MFCYCVPPRLCLPKPIHRSWRGTAGVVEVLTNQEEAHGVFAPAVGISGIKSEHSVLLKAYLVLSLSRGQDCWGKEW